MNIRIVVANEDAANFFDITRRGSPLRAAGGVANPAAGLMDQDLETDREGRGFSPVAAGRHGVGGERSTRRHANDLFARDIAHTLDTGRARQEFDRLVLVAGPRMLGLLRDALPAPCLSMVAAEVIKDLANHNTDEIRDAVPYQAFLYQRGSN